MAVFNLAYAAPGNGKGNDKESTDSASDPILFVHGYASGASIWDTMVDRFKADGWPEERLHAWSYNYNQSNKKTAEEVAAEVQALLERTGASSVDIITHSMGSLSSRYYAKFLNGDENIDAWVSLAGANHGTNWAYGCLSWSCFEMRPGSNFLSELNKGNETPGDMRYATWRSPCDTIIDPTDSVILKGADNTKKLCISHNWFVYDSGVYGEVSNFVQ
jgi:triacylglycerol lipase